MPQLRIRWIATCLSILACTSVTPPSFARADQQVSVLRLAHAMGLGDREQDGNPSRTPPTSLREIQPGVLPQRLALTDESGRVCALAVVWTERSSRASGIAGEEQARGESEGELRVGALICRDGVGASADPLPTWSSWYLRDDALCARTLLPFQIHTMGHANGACPSFAVESAVHPPAPAPAPAPAPRAEVAAANGVPAARVAQMHTHALSGIAIACVEPRSKRADEWLGLAPTGVARSAGRAQGAFDVGFIASSLDPIAVISMLNVLDVRAALLQERGDTRAAIQVRDDAVWLLRQSGAPVLAARVASSMPARVERDAAGAVAALPLVSLDRCFSSDAWEVVVGLERAQAQRARDLVRVQALADEICAELRLHGEIETAARELLRASLARLVSALPTGVSLRPEELREISRRLTASIAADVTNLENLRSEILTGVWEAWGRLGGETSALAPSERALVERQRADAIRVASEAINGFSFAESAENRDLPASLGPQLAARIEERLSDPWSPWTRFPAEAGFLAGFEGRLDELLAGSADEALTSGELLDRIELELSVALATSWSEDSVEGSRIAPFAFEGLSIVGVSGQRVRPMIRPR